MKDAQGREIKYLRVSVTDRCNLRCKYCMPNGIECVEHKDILSFEEIRQIAVCGARLGITKIRLTGGEPLLREGMAELITAILSDPQRRVEIETNGSVDLSPYCELERRPSFTMDYKMPDSGMEHAMRLSNMEKLSSEDTVKFVVSSRSDMERALEIIEKYDLRERTAVYFSPVFGRIEPVEMVDFLMEKKLNDVKIQIQLHKMIWDPQKRGV